MSNGPGQPTVVTPEVVSLLVTSFQDGLNVTQACWQANISRDTYYSHYNSDPEFSDKMDRARQFLSMNGRKKVKEAMIKGDMKTIRWFLERRDKDDFSSRTEVTGRNGKPLGATLDPDEKARLDKIWARKHGSNNTTSESTPGNDQPVDQPGGGSEGQSVS